ncbi:MAG: bifunctional riboflavin kinase/FAD synthetase [Granulosicoccus sp.]
MQLIRNISRWPDASGCAATIGNFDGVHRGHQAMFSDVKNAATRLQLPSTVISFEPLPHEYFAGSKAPGRLQGLRDRVASTRACGIDRLLLLPFNQALASLSAEDFVQQVLIKAVGVKHLVIGDDFRFGHQRKGDGSLLQTAGIASGFDVVRQMTISDEGQRISSSKIRDLLKSGELTDAARLLGRPYRISGRVVHGEKVGRQLGFPTANIALQGLRPPLSGVFAVTATELESGTRFKAVANLGERPTIGGRKLLLEVHLLDQERALYGKHLAVDFITRLRGEQRFASLDELKAQIGRDADAARYVQAGLTL